MSVALNNTRKEFIEKSWKELDALTKKMDIPSYKRRNARWLLDHAEERNAHNPDLPKVIEIAEKLISIGVVAG